MNIPEINQYTYLCPKIGPRKSQIVAQLVVRPYEWSCDCLRFSIAASGFWTCSKTAPRLILIVRLFTTSKISRVFWARLRLSRSTIHKMVARPFKACVQLPGILICSVRLYFYIFWPFGTVGFNTFIWEQRSAQPGARRHEGCRICHYLSWTDSIKPSLLFSNFGCCISKGSFFHRLFWTRSKSFLQSILIVWLFTIAKTSGAIV